MSPAPPIRRYAIYYTPPPDDLLTRRAASWLGRDPFTGAVLPRPRATSMSEADIARHTAQAARYGFHATLKAPFRLAPGRSERELAEAVMDFAAAERPIDVPRLVIGQIDGFFALVPERPAAELDRLAGRVVEAFEPFRAPLSEAELARRNPDTLDSDQFTNLHRWGYPHVFESFRFHMTLSDRVTESEAVRMRAALDEVLGEALLGPARIEGLALFVEPEPGAAFRVHAYCTFGAGSAQEGRSNG